jgi:hypothetical protein
MKHKLYELNLPPLAFFIGEVVKVLTNLREEVSEDGMESGGQISIIGQVVESDNMYLTLGYFDDNGAAMPQMAIKHSEIQLVKKFDPNEEASVRSSQDPSNAVN